MHLRSDKKHNYLHLHNNNKRYDHGHERDLVFLLCKFRAKGYRKDTNQKMMNGLRDGFSVREDLREVPGAQDVPQRGGGKQPGGPVN